MPCLLGTRGATLKELMALSGATIKVSQRDELIPGTNNRIVTCSGSPQATQTAQFLIQQKLAQQAAAPPGPSHHYHHRNQLQTPQPPPPAPSAHGHPVPQQHGHMPPTHHPEQQEGQWLRPPVGTADSRGGGGGGGGLA